MTPAETLLAMSDDEFRSVVNQDLRKGAAPELATALRSPAVFERWWGALIGMSKSIEGQLGAKREEYLASHANVLARIKKSEKDLARNRRLQHPERVEAAEDKLLALEVERLGLIEEYHHTRSGALRFKSGLEEWLAQAATIRRMRRES